MTSQDLPEELPEATISESDGVRFLHLGSIWVQGAMRIRKPQVVELAYVQRMLASLLWLAPETLGSGRALQLGLGAGAITRFTHKALHWPTTVVELNPHVIEAGRLWFHLPAEVDVVQADAGRWLRQQATPQSVRLLHVDLYDHEAAAPVLDDEAFYADCRRVLDDDGVFSVNLFGRDASFERSARRIAAAFGMAQCWRVQPTREGNSVVVATRSHPLAPHGELLRRAAALETRFKPMGLEARKWPRMIKPLAAVLEGVSNATLA